MSFKAQITADIDGFSKGINQATKEIDRLQKTVEERLSDVGKSMENIGKKASILSAALVAAGGKAFSMAADFEDAMGATDQIFKDASASVQEWAKSLSPQYGIAKKEALEYSNLMGSMLINIGKLTEEQASKQSAKLIELAGDLTAMYGGKTQDAVRALTGALKGNNTMLDNYGMAVNEALIKTKALEMGLISQGQEMSLAAKQAATLALIYEQTGAAQGQAAREADGASGSMRALKTEIANLSTEIGEVLLPIITPVISKIRDMVSYVRELSPEMRKLAVNVGLVVAAAGPLLVVTGKILQVLPQIKAAAVALINPLTAIGVTIGIVAINFHKNIDAMKTDWDFFTEHLKTTSAGFKDVLSGNFDGWWDKVKGSFSKNMEYLKTKWDQFLEYFTGKKKLNIDQTALEAALAANELTGSAGAMKEVAQNSVIAAAGVDKLTDSVKKLNDVQSFKPTTPDPGKVGGALTGLNISPTITPVIDTSLIQSAMGELIDQTKVLSLDIGNMVGGSITDMMNGIGSALASGEGIIDAIGKTLLSTMGNLAKQLGAQMIAFGTAGIALKKLMMNPYAAIAAGAALVALGAAASAAASKMMNSYTGGYSGGTSSYNNVSSPGASEYRGAYQDDFVVTFVQKGSDLVGVLNTAEQRRYRL